MLNNPCLKCGACCAYYRASFYWAECDDATENGVPADMTEKLNDFRRIMKGTNGSSPWCIALKGIIGGQVCCEIYERRSSVCQAFEPSWYGKQRNERCDKARQAWGLAPLQPWLLAGPWNGYPALQGSLKIADNLPDDCFEINNQKMVYGQVVPDAEN